MIKVQDCRWFPFSDEPIVQSTKYAPSFSDPQVITPDQACDNKWHLFFHSWIGIHHFVSQSGIAWQPVKMIEFRGHSPFIFNEGDCYYLIYEKHDKELPFFGNKRADGTNDNGSRIEVLISTDLLTWSKPRLLLDANDIPFAGDYVKSPRVSRPQLIKLGNQYRLYFGASSVKMPDCSVKSPRYFMYATSNDILGPYTVQSSEIPLMQVNPDDKWANLSVGSIRIVPCEKQILAFQCAMFWDSEEKKSKSSLIMMESEDGLRFRRCGQMPILINAEKGWARSYIMSCDVHYMEDEKTWYCYFSAMGDRKTIRKESIGLLLGTVPPKATT